VSPFGERFANYKSILPCPITTADKRIFYAVGMGDLRIEVPNGESSTPIVLKDVLHALDMGITIRPEIPLEQSVPTSTAYIKQSAYMWLQFQMSRWTLQSCTGA
jgi:hypothetical protein